MHDNHPLTIAARYGDAGAEEHGLEEYLKSIGIDIEVVMHVASQRALRLVLLTMRGEVALLQLSKTKATPMKLSAVEEAMCERFTLAVLDGIAVGWRGRAISAEDLGM